MDEVKKKPKTAETNLQAGERLYHSTCMACHGTERQGSGNYPTLIDVNKKYNEQQFAALVTSGRRMMPAFKHLAPSEIQALASFVLDNKKEQQQKFVPPVRAEDQWRNLPYTSTGYNKFLTKEGYPAIKPPWGTLSAINLNTGETLWKDTVGDYPDMKAKGIHTGTEMYGGPAVTAGGLVFLQPPATQRFVPLIKEPGNCCGKRICLHPVLLHLRFMKWTENNL